ncbi:MAG: fatty acid--CoA ligase, partial [Pseudomonadota bacterium]
DDTGKEVAIGDVGEILIRCDSIMKGYWNREADTKSAFFGDWYRSGDAGYMDEDGYIYLFDRVKDMIVSGAENIYPAEVEAALMDHPAVKDVAVIGVPDEKWGEAVKAIVVSGGPLGEAELIAFAKTKIAGYKSPKSVDFTDELPRNPSGKILKKELRKPYWPEDGRRVG